ncbi:MAG: hypothetical protein AB1726_06280 [Planctomycetota bacterium]
MKRTKRFLPPTLLGGLLLGTTLAAGPAAALRQEAAPAPAEELPAARTIIDRYLDVSGWRKVAPKYTSQRTTGTIEIVGMGIKGTFTEMSRKPDRNRMSMQMDIVGEVQSGFDGKIAWRIHPMLGEAILEGAEREQLVRRSTFPDFTFKDPKGYEKIETVGKEDFEGQACWAVRFLEIPYAGLDLSPEEAKEIREFTEYYAVESGLLVGTKTVAASAMGNMPTTTSLSDFQEHEGLLVPRKTVIDAASQKIQVVVKTIELDVVEESEFALPPEIEKLRQAEEAAAGGAGEGEGGGGK